MMFKQMFAVLTILLLCQVGFAQNSSLKSADKDSDGKVTVKELSEYAGSKLQTFDQDQLDSFAKKVDADGEITEKEFGNRMQALQSVRDEAENADKVDGEESGDETKPHVVGDKASDFELQSIDKKIKLSDVISKSGKPVIVVFSRANW